MDKSKTIRVLTVDDHELLRRGIRFALLPVDDLTLVGEAQDGTEAVTLCRELRPDVVLMDMRLTGDTDGIAATRAIREACPYAQVIILSSFHDKKLVQGAVQAGAIGYLIKGVSGDALCDAIRAAAAGKPTLDAAALEALAQPVSSEPPLGNDLTDREQDVLQLLATGMSNPEIAAALHLSVSAVKYHVSNILSKLGVANRTEAATIALEQRLVSKQ